MKKFTLQKQETTRKGARFIYLVTDENGVVISTRKSDRDYVACTADGSFYFGRLDLIGKGDHGKQIKYAQGWGRDEKDNLVPNMHEADLDRLEKLNQIAYLAPQSAPVEPTKTAEETKPADLQQVAIVAEAEFQAWIKKLNDQVAEWVKAGEDGFLIDDCNPVYMFSTTDTVLLSKIVKGVINPTFLAARELANRGLDIDGEWVGFDKADKIHNVIREYNKGKK